MTDFGETSDKVIIIGGGFGGLATAAALNKVGIPSIVLERAPKMRQEGFAIGAFTNTWRALKEIDADDAMREGTINLEGAEFLDTQGRLVKRIAIKDAAPPPYRPTHEVRVVKRERIPRVLSAHLPPGSILYGVNVTNITADDQGCEVEVEGGRKLRGRFAVLADGVHSKTAAKVHKAKLEYMQAVGWRGLVELDSEEIKEPMFTFVQQPQIRVGLIPMSYNAQTKKATWYWFFAMAAKEKADMGTKEEQKEQIMGLMKDWKVTKVKEVLGETPLEQFGVSHLYQRQVVAGKPWFEGCITAVGDAAHATTPFLAQGGAMALEDGVEMGVFLKKAMDKAGGVPFARLSPEAVTAALREYEIVRSHRVADIISKSRSSGQMFLSGNPVVGFLTRLLMPFLIKPAFLFGHAAWEPSGSLTSATEPAEHPPTEQQTASKQPAAGQSTEE